MIELYQRVVISRDLPDANLQAGDLAWLVDYVLCPEGKGINCLLEVYNALGEAIGVVTIPVSAIAPLSADHVPTVRELTKTG